MEHGYSTRRWCVCALACVLLGCPSRQDALSGTYREVPTAESGDELMALEFFRFGNYSNGIVRTFRVEEIGGETRETSCAWTTLGDAPDDDGVFAFRLPETTQSDEVRIEGAFGEGDELTLTMREGAQEVTKVLRLSDTSPDDDCDVVGAFFTQLKFGREGASELPEESGWTLQRPTFAMLWVGVEARVEEQLIIWGAVNDHTAELELSARHRDGDRGLTSSLSLSIPPPDDKVMVASGRTRYALGHFVVIDDVNASEGFRWDVSEEPIVASALQLGVEPDSPFPNATGLGKAMLYVEGRLSELHPNLRENIVNVEAYQNSRGDAHFYVVDVFFTGGDVIGMRLPEDPTFLTNAIYRQVTLEVTDRYLRSAEILLPRLLPIDEL